MRLCQGRAGRYERRDDADGAGDLPPHRALARRDLAPQLMMRYCTGTAAGARPLTWIVKLPAARALIQSHPPGLPKGVSRMVLLAVAADVLTVRLVAPAASVACPIARPTTCRVPSTRSAGPAALRAVTAAFVVLVLVA